MVLGIYGAGATAQELYEMMQTSGMVWDETVFIDDTQPAGGFMGQKRLPFACFCGQYDAGHARVVIAVGEPSVRARMHDSVKEKHYRLATVIHPTSTIAGTAQIGEGCVLKMHTILSSNARLQDNVFVQSHAVVGHDVNVGRDTIVSGGCFIAGHCTIGSGSFLGVHSCIREGITLGDRVVVAMMAAVMKDVCDDLTVAGNPARVMKANSRHLVFAQQGGRNG